MSRGGKRKGAGAKPKGDAPRIKINITIDAALLAWVDERTDNRSEYFNQLIAKDKENSKNND